MKNIFTGNAEFLIKGYLETEYITFTFLNITNISPSRKGINTSDKYKEDGCRVIPDINYFNSIPKEEDQLYDTITYYEYKGYKFVRYITPFYEKECYDIICIPTSYAEKLIRLINEDSKKKTEAVIDYPIIHSHFEEVKKHTIDFLTDEHFRDFCKTKFIKYKRGLIFEGKPGGGKSTCLKWLGKEAEKAEIKFRIFSSVDDFMDSTSEYMNDDKKIFIFEDFDAFIQERKLDSEHQQPNTILSTILNTIDGIKESNNTITIFTTNMVQSFDSAMIRPGRIDKVFSFDLPNDKDITDFIEVYLKDHRDKYYVTTYLIDKKKSYDITFAILKGICDDIHIFSYFSDEELTKKDIDNIIKEKLKGASKGKTQDAEKMIL